ncbi:hypothetical protein Kpol_1049p11 [Vanderwaltozyma polyspora DSM 70294]|uniref:Peroxisome assembly protein 22 n=1 Tax=Vanderwaltozyma polyspora (strain ATCC 22028 / DSM 70294 / BCRC 21397 / CBS 2163 / NBRC 10782 / NRRL Y-8283 / UCD 57-17) TaxID=436907 RepID=A7TPQ1_VANPO|nr:uncharacterized protein Kpol_1049p11 [Vanderwaltozyma polyspora DSM 70294]EDO15753.1 hypothetical protein Kpol_1049p11 [Vanderwaltozyma polyspora DSM 70294]
MSDLSRNNRLRGIVAGAAVAAALGVTGYIWWRNHLTNGGDDEDDDDDDGDGDGDDGDGDGNGGQDSKTIILTKSLCENKGIDWKRLFDTNCVVLVTPGLKFQPSKDSVNSTNDYKIIHCDTMEGLFSCAKHLGKKKLLYVPDELESGLPVDISRFVREVVELDSDNLRKDPELFFKY